MTSLRNDNATRVGELLSISMFEKIYSSMHEEMIDSLTQTLRDFFHERSVNINVNKYKGNAQLYATFLDAYNSSPKITEYAKIFRRDYYASVQNEGCSENNPCLECNHCKSLYILYKNMYSTFKKGLRTDHNNCLVYSSMFTRLTYIS